MKKILSVFLAVGLVLGLTSCAKKTFREAAKPYGFNTGIAVTSGDILDPEIQPILKDYCSIIVCENQMKMANLHPNKKFWNWNDVDKLVEFADENKIRVKWHTLFWHQQNAPFATSLTTREDALAFMDEYIETVMERYKGKIKEYDVVNEMFEDDGKGSFRNTHWYKTIGPDYIEHALRKAHEVDPNAKLYLNEYNNEAMGDPKADAMYNFVKELKEKGVPIDGVGMQLHLDTSYPYNEDAIRKNIQRYADLGIEISFSEVDVRIPTNGGESHVEKQKEIYCSLVKLAKEMPNVKSFITWGFTDRHSWVPATFPGKGDALPFDKDMKPKPVFQAMIDELNKK